jgi:ASCH domain
VQFSRDLRERVTDGTITVSYRLWARPKVKVGGVDRSTDVLIEIDDIDLVPFSSLTDEELAQTGEPDLEGLRRRTAHAGPVHDDALVYRVEFHDRETTGQSTPMTIRRPREASPGPCIPRTPVPWPLLCSECLPLDEFGKIRKGGCESYRVVLGGDAIWDVVGSDVDASPSIDSGDLPGHGRRAGEGRIVGNEVHCLDDADVRNDVDVSSLDDGGIIRGLSRGARSVGVGQDQSVGADARMLLRRRFCDAVGRLSMSVPGRVVSDAPAHP